MSLGQTLVISLLSLSFLSGCASTNPHEPKNISKKERVKLLIPVAQADIADNDSTSALETLNQIRDMDDTVPDEYYLYALAYQQKNEMKLAIESARRAVKLDPKFSAAKNALGKMLLDQGKFEEAEKWLLEASSDLLYREVYLAKTNLGMLYYKEGKFEKSENWLSQAIRDDGALVCVAYYYRGLTRSETGDLRNAERDLANSAKGGCSGMTDAHIAYGKVLIREKKYDQARAKFVEIQRLFPDSDASDKATQYLREIP